MKALIIGGRGKVGSYLVPRLLRDGFDVVNVSRGSHEPLRERAMWSWVEQMTVDRAAAEADGSFGKLIAGKKPDVVIDMICFSASQLEALIEPLMGDVSHFLVCGSCWMHGKSTLVPVEEHQDRDPFGDYGIQKEKIDRRMTELWAKQGFPGTTVHPGHIVCPGDVPINPQGNKNIEVYRKLMTGAELTIPNDGHETVHHVHADDVAQVFERAILNPQASLGEGFHATSPQAVSLEGYARAFAKRYGKEANLRFLPFEEWKKTVCERDADMTEEHITRSPACSIAKAKKLLGYEPRYTSLDAVFEAVDAIDELK